MSKVNQPAKEDARRRLGERIMRILYGPPLPVYHGEGQPLGNSLSTIDDRTGIEVCLWPLPDEEYPDDEEEESNGAADLGV